MCSEVNQRIYDQMEAINNFRYYRYERRIGDIKNSFANTDHFEKPYNFILKEIHEKYSTENFVHFP